jgi:DNA-binding TFAR19-related protein (PDSD5 family)
MNPAMMEGAAEKQMAQQRQQQEQQQQAQAKRNMMVQSILEGEAKQRLDRIRIVKPEKARAVEDMLIGMVQQGQIKEKVDEKRLINYISMVTDATTAPDKKITVLRQTAFDDDEEEDYSYLE